MEISLKLDSLKFANVSDFTRTYGTKVQTNGGSLTTKEFNEDMAKIYDLQRPIEVTEDSTTGTVEYNANIVMNSATAITLSLGNGTYVGCKVSVLNISNVIHKVVIDTNTYSLLSGIAKEFVWNGSAWIQKSVIIDTNPSGTIISFAGSTAPAGYIQCDGRAISRTDYSQLFNAIGTTYGEGDGTTTFNVPKCNQKLEDGVELMTGERDSDGRPIYRLIFRNENIEKGGSINVGLVNVKTFISVNLNPHYHTNDRYYQGGYISGDTAYYGEIYYDKSLDVIRYIAGSSRQPTKIIAIFEYTKTTDTASSPCYNQIASEGISCIKAV